VIVRELSRPFAGVPEPNGFVLRRRSKGQPHGRYERVVSDGHDAAFGVARPSVERVQLLEIKAFDPRLFFQDSGGRVAEALPFIDETPRQRPHALEGLLSHPYEKHLETTVHGGKDAVVYRDLDVLEDRGRGHVCRARVSVYGTPSERKRGRRGVRRCGRRRRMKGLPPRTGIDRRGLSPGREARALRGFEGSRFAGPGAAAAACGGGASRGCPR